MQKLTQILGALAVTAAVIAVPGDLRAQDNQPNQPNQDQDTQTAPACTAEVQPTEMAAGESAVRLTVALSSNVGDVESIEAPEGSGLALSTAADLPRIPLATEEPSAITPAMDDNTWTVWMNTSASEPGSYEVAFIGPEGRCTTDLTVTESI